VAEDRSQCGVGGVHGGRSTLAAPPAGTPALRRVVRQARTSGSSSENFPPASSLPASG
jgi:hypothetical protein